MLRQGSCLACTSVWMPRWASSDAVAAEKFLRMKSSISASERALSRFPFWLGSDALLDDVRDAIVDEGAEGEPKDDRGVFVGGPSKFSVSFFRLLAWLLNPPWLGWHRGSHEVTEVAVFEIVHASAGESRASLVPRRPGTMRPGCRPISLVKILSSKFSMMLVS